MEIKLYLQMLQRGWWLIVLTILIALMTSLTISYLTVPQYQATARFLITPNTSVGSGSTLVDSLDNLSNRSIVTTYAEVMNSQRIAADALTAIHLQPTILANYVNIAVVLPETSVLELNVIGPDPKVAADLANSIGTETINFTDRINQVYDLNFLDIAVVPQVPISPQPIRDMAVAFALGLVGGAILAILSEQIRVPLETYRQRFRLDRVTGVYNRRFMIQLIEDEIAKDRDTVLSIGILELDHFQDLLSTLSNATSQKILLRITDTLRKEFRGNDIIGRWSDASFVVMMPSTSGYAANRIFDRVFQALPVDLMQFGFDIKLEPHIGGAEYSNNISIGELIEKAENALEEARKDASKPVQVWTMKSPFWIQDGSFKG